MNWPIRTRLAILYTIVVASFSLLFWCLMIPDLPPLPAEEGRLGISLSPLPEILLPRHMEQGSAYYVPPQGP